eukprot:981804_1
MKITAIHIQKCLHFVQDTGDKGISIQSIRKFIQSNFINRVKANSRLKPDEIDQISHLVHEGLANGTIVKGLTRKRYKSAMQIHKKTNLNASQSTHIETDDVSCRRRLSGLQRLSKKKKQKRINRTMACRAARWNKRKACTPELHSNGAQEPLISTNECSIRSQSEASETEHDIDIEYDERDSDDSADSADSADSSEDDTDIDDTSDETSDTDASDISAGDTTQTHSSWNPEQVQRIQHLMTKRKLSFLSHEAPIKIKSQGSPRVLRSSNKVNKSNTNQPSRVSMDRECIQLLVKELHPNCGDLTTDISRRGDIHIYCSHCGWSFGKSVQTQDE